MEVSEWQDGTYLQGKLDMTNGMLSCAFEVCDFHWSLFFFFEMFTACKVPTGIRLSNDHVCTKARRTCTLLIVAVRQSGHL